jgi:hypothetical protein
MIKAEYVVAGSCCAQFLWMRQTLKDYGYIMNLSYVDLILTNLFWPDLSQYLLT